MIRNLSIRNAVTDSDPLKTFHRFFDGLQAPMILCAGLEIVAANDPAERLFTDLGTSLIGTHVNALFFDTSTADQLFEKNGSAVTISLADQKFLLRATPWQENEEFWLVEWQDQTLLDTLTSQLAVARKHDMITGTLLPWKFNNLLQTRIENQATSILAYICLGNLDLPADGISDIIIQLADRISYEFGDDVWISRYDTCTVALSMSTIQGQAEEHSHILRQLNRICSQVTASDTLFLAMAAHPMDGDDVATLNKAVQLAMGDAKKHVRTALYSAELGEEAIRLEKLACDMSDAIADNEITPHFQPIVDSKTGKIKSFESLVRWIHPEFGYISPPDIIQIALDNSLLHRLTEHVLQKSIEEAKHWPSYVQFAVNVTPSQLTSDLVNLVRQHVRSAGIDPARLAIEVTEDAIIDNIELSTTIFSRLRSIGVAIAMDDFGAGFTSIANLTKLDFDKIKIDKSISDGLPYDNRSVAIVKSMLLMCRELKIEITIEGIEEQEQVDFLRAYECGIQGYFFSRPLPARDLPNMQKFLNPINTIATPRLKTG